MNATQEIYVLNKRLKLLHTEHGFKTSIDSVLLAASCPARAGDHILDMGCGVGGAGLCVLTRVEGVHLTGVEIQADHAKLAKRNAKANNFQEHTQFLSLDIRDFCCDQSYEYSFDHVICNPPYLEAGEHLRSPHEEKATAMGGVEVPCAQARGHDDENLSVLDWIDAAYACLRSNGTMSMIHRADRVDRIIKALGKRFGAVEIIPLWPKQGVDAKRVIVRAIKHRKSPAIIRYGLILHDKDGQYTVETEQILREMVAL